MGAARWLAVMRVVLDTNVLVSALVVSPERFVWLNAAWKSRDLVPLLSADTLPELVRAVQYPKFRTSYTAILEAFADYLPWCEMVAVPAGLPVPVCRDPRDVPFLELAVAGQADALVSGDGDLLALKPDFDIPILRPGELRLMLGGQGA